MKFVAVSEEKRRNWLIRRRLTVLVGLHLFPVGLVQTFYRYNFDSIPRNLALQLSKPILYNFESFLLPLWKNVEEIDSFVAGSVILDSSYFSFGRYRLSIAITLLLEVGI